MRIQTYQNLQPTSRTSSARISNSKFSEIMDNEQGKLDEIRLQKLLQEIGKQGERLAESRTVEDLQYFKSLVKRFMEEAVEYGLSLEERSGWTRRGRSKTYKIVKQIDEKLIQLTDSLLDKEKKSMDILATVGEIKGLLVNLYA
ncbi:YaaR family protein [Rubeoparvulum massiliense]|uniref:YaaR family protein n=1 Tax=Rubeoparvulum massiliense TaxID=1631346 RepID=UPI00065E431A|nr:YaaR family protein [Rubeoparvulum massiliense]